MKVKSPPQITGEKTGTMGNTHYISVGRAMPVKGDLFSESVPHSWSPPQITGEKTGTIGGIPTILVWVGRCQSKGTYSQSLSGMGVYFITVDLGRDSNVKHNCLAIGS